MWGIMIRVKVLLHALRATVSCALLLATYKTVLAAEATGTASATVLQPVTVAKIADLDFGKIVSGPSASTVSLSPAGLFQCGTGITCLDSHSAARFSVSGVPGHLVNIQSDSQIMLSATGGQKMQVALETSAKTLKLNSGSNNFIDVGGTLSVGAFQAEGVYTGLFTITVNYF